MFDTYYPTREVAVPYAKTVKEYKAPTDDSIRLYHEMLTKAQQSLLDSFKITNTSLDVIVNITHSPYKHGKYGMYKCTINGVNLYGEVPIETFMCTREEVAHKIVDDIAKQLAKQIAVGLLIEDDKYSRFSGGNFR